MKNVILSLALITAMSNVGFANENTDTVESQAVESSPEDKGFYAGLAYSHLSHDIDFQRLSTNVELDFNAIMLDIGYKFNPYVAVEARYNISLGDTDVDDHLNEAEMSVLSFFVKPMYPIAPEMDIYALLGYSLTDAKYSQDIISFDEGSFSWGAGASYDLTEDFSIFAEYAQFYNDTLNGFDYVVDSFNLGVTYKL